MEFFRPEYWSGWPCPSPGDLPNPGIEPRSPTLQADSLPVEPQGSPYHRIRLSNEVPLLLEFHRHNVDERSHEECIPCASNSATLMVLQVRTGAPRQGYRQEGYVRETTGILGMARAWPGGVMDMHTQENSLCLRSVHFYWMSTIPQITKRKKVTEKKNRKLNCQK